MDNELKALDLHTRCEMVCDAVREALEDAEVYEDDNEPGMALVEHDDEPNIYVYDDHAVACIGAGEDIKIPYAIEDGDVIIADPSEWRNVEWDVTDIGAYNEPDEDTTGEVKSLGDMMVCDGASVKAMGDGRTFGYLVRFGDPDRSAGDLSAYRDIFMPPPNTDYGAAKSSDVYVHHRQLPGLGKRQLQHQAEIGYDDVGIFVKHLLDMRDPYEKALYHMAQQGKLGWSSGTAQHLVERKALGDGRHIITKWPLGLDASYTPTPAGGMEMTTSALKALVALIDDSPEAEHADASVKATAVAETEIAERRRRLLLELDLMTLEATA